MSAIKEAAKNADPPEPPPRIVEFPRWPDEDRVAAKLWILQAPYRYVYELGDWMWRITVPAGFLYNGASVPRLVWSVVQPDKLHKASSAHDLAYRSEGRLAPGEWEYHDGRVWRPVERAMTRKEADQIFRIQITEDPAGPGPVDRSLAYRALRWFGGPAWGGDGPEVLR